MGVCMTCKIHTYTFHKDMLEFADSSWIYTWQTLITKEGFLPHSIALRFGLPMRICLEKMLITQVKTCEWMSPAGHLGATLTRELIDNPPVASAWPLGSCLGKHSGFPVLKDVTKCYRSTCWEGKRNNKEELCSPSLLMRLICNKHENC